MEYSGLMAVGGIIYFGFVSLIWVGMGWVGWQAFKLIREEMK